MRATAPWLLLLTLGACTGKIEFSKPKPPEQVMAPADPPAVTPPCNPTAKPGRVVMHRLNRREYDNTIRDLFGLSIRPAESFPADNVATYFDNDSALLGITADQLEADLHAAEDVATAALANAHATVVDCNPSGSNAESCARHVIERWGRRLFRRSLEPADVDFIYTNVFTPAGGTGTTFDDQLGAALTYLLTSPRFLYRVELHSAPDDPTKIEPLDGPALASRLSYFIWSSTPDDQLLDLAEQIDPATSAPRLATPAELSAQLDRMLTDPRAGSLADDFASQWLGVAQLDLVAKSPTTFPTFTDALRADMKTETQLFLRELFAGGHPLGELLSARYGYVDDRLAQHYGLPGITGAQFRKVDFPAGFPRSGYLSQASFLAINSEIGRTSVVKRGEYVLSRLLCAPPGPPPENVPPLPPEVPGDGQTLRQRLEAHRSNPACSGCHARMDPIGFGLENFDAIGAWRTVDNGSPIDASGTYLSGTSFDGAVELSELIGKDPLFEPCVSRNLMTWALGRSLTPEDACAVTTASKNASTQQPYQLVRAIAQSPAFLTHQGDDGH
ncbi:MAG: DUF1592 domain-containing protein [Myxococcaceae bacterium]